MVEDITEDDWAAAMAEQVSQDFLSQDEVTALLQGVTGEKFSIKDWVDERINHLSYKLENINGQLEALRDVKERLKGL